VPVQIILDCDPGIDDAMAISYLAALGPSRGVLAGVGSVHGNVPAPTGARNALQVLDVNGVSGVPVRIGAAKPLAQPLDTGEMVHGDDGLGGQADGKARALPEPGPAAEQIVRLAQQRPGEMTLVAIGPLTNIALALLLEPNLPDLIPHIVVMGGAVESAGNITPSAEANVWHDPEAAALVIEAQWRTTFVSLDASMQTVLSDEQLEVLASATSARGKFVWAILQHYLDFYVPTLGRRTCPLHDPLAMALALDPDLATYRSLPTHVEIAPGPSRGATIADRRGNSSQNVENWPLVNYVDELDVERFQAMFLTAMTT
jgi:purine nucleosidase